MNFTHQTLKILNHGINLFLLDYKLQEYDLAELQIKRKL